MRLTRNVKIVSFFGILIISCASLIVYNYIQHKETINDYWNLTITGAIEEDVVISYESLIGGELFTIYNDIPFHMLNNFPKEWDITVAGVIVEDILNYVSDKILPSATGIYFKAADEYYTPTIPLTFITGTNVMVIYKENGEVLKSKTEGGDGPLRGIVNFSFTDPEPNSIFYAKYLNQIVIV